MKVAQVVAAGEDSEPIARDIERVVGYLTAQLAADGHDVTVFACGPASRPSITQASRFDLIHLHGDVRRFAHLGNVTTLIAATLHSYPNPSTLTARAMLPDVALAAVSAHQRDLFPGLRWHAVVPHGLPERLHPFSIDPDNHLAYVGSLKCVRSLRRAVEIAMRSRMPLKIADRIVGRELRQLEQQLAPLINLGASVEFVGELDSAAFSEFLGGARALLFTNEWSGPCPLAVLDALACGTPVIGWRAGAIETLIEQGRSGFIIGSVDEAVSAVADLDRISRLGCRRAFDERFSAQRMARDYAALYAQLLSMPRQVARYAALGGRASIGQGGVL